MATRDRREYVVQSIRYFEREDYPNRELIIIDDGTDDLSRILPASDRIRYVCVRAGSSIGAKRNRGCELARGTMIAQWDDDDWYAPRRLSAQLSPIIAGEAEITGLRDQLCFDLPRWKFWACEPMLHRQIFVEDAMGETLVFRRACWEKLSRYPDCSLAEDAISLRQAVARGARLTRISDPGLLLYLRHYGNTWQFECGKFVDPNGWAKVSEPTWLQGDRAFYLSRSRTALPRVVSAHTSEPLVSCIMPTANRDRFVPNAIRYFLRQTYPNRELLILDDGDINIADLVPASERIRHVRLPSRYPIGAKRNLACEMAQGEIIAHWDNDAWLADWRLAYQVDVLRKIQSAGVSGLSKLYFSEPSAGSAWLYSHPGDQCTWVAGGTLCYCKSLWRRFSFADFADAEDTAFIASVPEESIVKLLNKRSYVATVHAGNTSRKVTGDPGWQTIPPTTIRTLIAEDRITRLRRTPTALPSVRGRVTEAQAAQAPHG